LNQKKELSETDGSFFWFVWDQDI